MTFSDLNDDLQACILFLGCALNKGKCDVTLDTAVDIIIAKARELIEKYESVYPK